MKTFERCLESLGQEAKKAFKNYMKGKTCVLGENQEILVHTSDWETFLQMKNWADYLD